MPPHLQRSFQVRGQKDSAKTILPGVGLLLALTLGCGEPVPELETWPAQGMVVDQKGEPLAVGAVQLETKSDAYLQTVGTVQPDGTFTLRTQRRGHSYPGAVAGKYTVAIYTEGIGADGSAYPMQLRVREPVVIEKSENNLTLKVHR